MHKAPAKAAAPGKPTGPVTFTDPEYAMGSATAPVTVVEYLSNVCSHCAHLDKDVWPAIKAKYVDTGKVRWVIREFLTPPEDLAAAGFVLARCTGKAHYWPTVEALFRAQEEMAKTQQIKAIYLRIAGEQGLSEAQFTACLDDKSAYDALNARMKKAVEADKVEFTPTLIINGKRPFEGVPSVGELSAALDAAGAG